MRRLTTSLATALLGSSILLSACGGGGGSGAVAPAPAPTPGPTPNSTFSVGGGIVGLGAASGLTLINNGADRLPVSANATAFTFVSTQASSTSYSVSIGSQPTGLSCTASNATGTVQQAEVVSVTVNCVPAQGKTPNSVSIFAGDDGQNDVDGVGTSARFGRPNSMVIDSAGNMYFSDSKTYTIRKISQSRVVTTFAGSTQGFVDGTGAAAKFSLPGALAIDKSDNLYVVDGNDGIRKISPSGVVSTLYRASDNRYFGGIAVDRLGNVYAALLGPYYRSILLKITPSGAASTLAGCDAGQRSFADGVGTAACFNGPKGLVMDSADNLYVADTGNNAIRKVTPSGVVTTLIGPSPYPDLVDGTGPAARIGRTEAIAIDAAGNLYIADSGNNTVSNAVRVRKITPTAVVTTLAGGSPGYANGPGAGARFLEPSGIAVDATGNVLVAESFNRAIRKVSPAGEVTTIAGQGPLQGFIDGVGTAARFSRPVGIAMDGAGNSYVADSLNYAIRKITPSGVVSIIAGGGGQGDVDSTGTAARFTDPRYIASDSTGTLYVLDISGYVSDGGGFSRVPDRIRKISTAGVVTTVATLAPSTISTLNIGGGIAVDSRGTVYITFNNAVLKLQPGGDITTLAGSDSAAGFVDGAGNDARFNAPKGLAVDTLGNVFVADFNNNVVRKISPQGQVTTLAGVGKNAPWAVTVDSTGSVYVAGQSAVLANASSPENTSFVYKLTGGSISSNVMDRSMATGGSIYPGLDGTGIAVDNAGNLYVTYMYADAILKITP